MAPDTSDQKHKTSLLPNFPELEEDILRYWEKERIFEQTTKKTKDGAPFVFFEGPPTANGKPGIHHVLARAFKDVVVRYQTMKGRFVERRAGWDTHGLPVELQVEKELGISGKKQIENIIDGDRQASIAEFNARCKSSVMSNINEWELLTKRIGFWLNFDSAYRTYTNDYIDSLWWIIKEMSQKNTPSGPLLFKGHKVVHHCPRCETALSSHEVAQGYKTTKDTSVYVKFFVTKSNVLKIQSLIEDGTRVAILSWTTTPWTLPGNVALAIHKKLTYALIKHDDEYLVLAKDRVNDVVGEDAKIELEFRGEDIVATTYDPLFPGSIEKGDSKTAWTVVPAEFVTAEDGTGVVHTAVMYGEDDYQLGLSAKLPTQHTVTQDGHFTDAVKGFAGMFVKDKDTEKQLVAYLHDNKLLYKVEPFEHEYPFCWRCSTPLLYYAKDSWYVRMSSLRKELLSNNEAINWVPDYLKSGRFGEWLKEVKDWAFSRERYWGTPLPIWECTSCGKREILGSIAEVEKRANPNTLPEDSRTVYFLRHGYAESNDQHVNRCMIEKDDVHLLPKGKQQVQKAAEQLKGKIDLIVTSDFIRTRETAEIVAQETGCDIVLDARLREYRIPTCEGEPTKDLLKEFPEQWMRWDDAPHNGEKLVSVARRMREAVIDRLQQFQGKRILFVSHGDPIWAFLFAESGQAVKKLDGFAYPDHSQVHTVAMNSIPLNPHRPYIDAIELACSCQKGATMKRIEEVADVWFDSGAMPFAQHHYPYENKERIDNGSQFPADYISEAIDQTRGWFYTLLAVSTVLGKGAPYKNVISLGHILDNKGEKMSKSKGNIVNPWEVMAETGSDALRFHFYSMNQPGEVKLFNIDGVREVVRKTMMILWNVQSFYVLYAKTKRIPKKPNPTYALDVWLMNRLERTRKEVTDHLDSFSIFEAARTVRDFVTELSTWYVRRSRARLKEGQAESMATFGYTLYVTTQMLAPFMPFFAEILFKRQRGGDLDGDSIHLSEWPEQIVEMDSEILRQMESVKSIVETMHSIRKEQNIKSRQPLARAAITVELSDALCNIIAEEVNIDTVEVVQKVSSASGWVTKEKNGIIVSVQTAITPELQRRGKIRELIRNINDLRKLARLTPDDRINLYVHCSSALETFMKEAKPEIAQETGLDRLYFSLPDDVDVKKNVRLGEDSFTIGLKHKQ